MTVLLYQYKLIRLCFSIMVAGIVFMGCMKQSGLPGNQASLPENVNGWKAALPDTVYDRDTLFSYIDGGAELYRAFNVVETIALRAAAVHAPSPETRPDCIYVQTTRKM